MPRYLVTRTFTPCLDIPHSPEGQAAVQSVVDGNLHHDVTWVQSYVTPDKTTTFCIYDGPSPEAIRSAAEETELPVDSITEVRVLDPYFYV